MKLSVRSFPHPVVGNGDDVPGAAFQATTEMTTDREFAYLDARVSCSSNTINALVQQEKASFVMHVECGNTLFRRAYDFRTSEGRFPIRLQLLNEDVEVNVFARANTEISGYQVANAHPEYGSIAFEVKRGDVLAVAEGRVFTIESDFESIQRIGSIMQIAESNLDEEHPIRADFLGDKIMIILSKKDFAQYKLLKHNESFVGPLTTIIVLPALMEAIQYARDYARDEDPETGPRWIRLVLRKIESMRLKLEDANLELAQRLLDLPVRRALNSAKQMVEE